MSFAPGRSRTPLAELDFIRRMEAANGGSTSARRSESRDKTATPNGRNASPKPTGLAAIDKGLRPYRAVNHADGTVRHERMKSEERRRKLVDPPKLGPDQKISEQYRAAREHLKTVQPIARSVDPHSVRDASPSWSKEFWERKAERHRATQRQSDPLDRSVSSEPYGHKVEDKSPSRTSSVGRIVPGHSTAEKHGTPPPHNSARRVPARRLASPMSAGRRPTAVVRNGNNGAGMSPLRQMLSAGQPVSGSDANLNSARESGTGSTNKLLTPKERRSTPSNSARSPNPNTPFGDEPRRRAGSTTTKPRVPGTSSSPAVKTPSRRAESPTIPVRTTKSAELRGRTTTTGATGGPRDPSLSSVRSASAESGSRKLEERPPFNPTIRVPSTGRSAGTIPSVSSSRASTSGATERTKSPQLRQPSPYGRPPHAKPPPGSLEIRAPSPQSRLGKVAAKESVSSMFSPIHKAHLRAQTGQPNSARSSTPRGDSNTRQAVMASRITRDTLPKTPQKGAAKGTATGATPKSKAPPNLKPASKDGTKKKAGDATPLDGTTNAGEEAPLNGTTGEKAEENEKTDATRDTASLNATGQKQDSEPDQETAPVESGPGDADVGVVNDESESIPAEGGEGEAEN